MLFTQPISVDAATTFSYFTSRGINQVIGYYPAPNNHVLHTFFTWLLYHPGPYQTYLMRVPAFLFGLAGLGLFYAITKKKFGGLTALAALALFGAIEPIIYYGYIARGYSMLVFFSLVAIYFWLKDPSFSRTWPAVFFMLMMSLGIYTIPSHLYFMFAFSVGVALMYMGKKVFWKTMLRLVLLNLGAILVSIMAYMPIINRQGIKVLISNKYVEARDWISLSEWLEHFSQTSEYYLFFSWGIFALGALAVVVVVKRKQMSALGLMSSAVLLTVFIIPLLHRTLPFHRVWIFLTPFLFWLVLDFLHLHKGQKLSVAWKYTLLAGSVVVAGLWTSYSVQKLIRFERGTRAFKRLADELIEKRYSPVYLQDFYAHTFLPYHYANSELAGKVQVTIDGNTNLGAEDWQRLCNGYRLLVLNPSFKHDTIIGRCVIDTSWTNVLLTPEACECVMEKLKDLEQQRP